ncbi:MAG: ribosome silencing factor [Truepera sp.]|nr:ribosome silencing factor [Truepera sp.]MDE0098238.1 ribosome silencing factor [Truepera sp.]
MTETATVPKEVWLVVAALDDKRARDIVVLDLTKVSDSLDYFVLATAESTLQLRALQESVKERLKRSGAQPRGIEGPSERWVLIDYGSVVVHLMSPEAREFYDLEGLWIDAEHLEVVPG